MKNAWSVLIFLSLISNGLMLDLNVFWPIIQSPFVTTPIQTVDEPAGPIEIVTWRQPVCLMPAEGVSPCYLGIRKLQDEYDGNSQKPNLRSSARDEVQMPLGIVASDLPILQSSEGPEEPAIDGSRTPELTTKVEKEARRTERMYPGFARRTTPKPQQIYVTRVVNSPSTATLVAHNCLPDIGIPLCRDYEPLQPSKPVVASETESPTTMKPENSQNPSEHVIHSSQNFGNAVKPIPTTRPSELPQSSLGGHQVCHSCDLNDPTPGNLQHIVISVKPAGEVVETKPQTVATSGSPYFDSEVPDQRIKTPQLSIQLSRNSGSHEIEGQPPVEASEGKRNTIFQTIHDMVNRTESLPILQKLQSLLNRRPPALQEVVSSQGILGNIFRPINLFNRNKGNNDTMAVSSIVRNNSSVSSGPETSTKAIVITRQPTIMDILYKPENDISNSSGLLDVSESAGDNVDAESLAKPAGKPGLLGDLFADPVEPIEPENEKVEAEEN